MVHTNHRVYTEKRWWFNRRLSLPTVYVCHSTSTITPAGSTLQAENTLKQMKKILAQHPATCALQTALDQVPKLRLWEAAVRPVGRESAPRPAAGPALCLGDRSQAWEAGMEGRTGLIFQGKTTAARDVRMWRTEPPKAEATWWSGRQTSRPPTLDRGTHGHCPAACGAPEPKAAAGAA